MKKRYSQILQETIDMSNPEKYMGTVGDILSYKGDGNLQTHKKVSNIVSVLEEMYFKEDNDLPTLGDGEETRIPSGEGPSSKIHSDIDEKDLGDTHRAKGGAEVNPDDTDQFDNTIMDESLFEDDDDVDIDSEPDSDDDNIDESDEEGSEAEDVDDMEDDLSRLPDDADDEKGVEEYGLFEEDEESDDDEGEDDL